MQEQQKMIVQQQVKMDKQQQQIEELKKMGEDLLKGKIIVSK